MTWTVTHHRGAILRAVAHEVNAQNTGLLPMHLEGVAETFHDELDVIAGLYLQWHARLSANVDDALMAENDDPAGLVAGAWAKTAQQLPGIRRVIDTYTENPLDDRMADALDKARRTELARLGCAAGASQLANETAEHTGEEIVSHARGLAQIRNEIAAVEAASAASAAETSVIDPVEENLAIPAQKSAQRNSFADRIRAALAA